MFLIFNVLSIIMEVMGVCVMLAGKWVSGTNNVVFFNETFFIGLAIMLIGLVLNSVFTFFVLDSKLD